MDTTFVDKMQINIKNHFTGRNPYIQVILQDIFYC